MGFRMNDFREESRERIARMNVDSRLHTDARALTLSTIAAKYSYNFFWQGRPVIQYPQDIVALQEIIWETRPDLVVETGIAHGGSLMLSASMLALLDLYDAVEAGITLDPRAARRRVLGVDIDIRTQNRAAIEAHPLGHIIHMIQGSSINSSIVDQVHRFAEQSKRILVILDSNHTHEHVLAELEAYAPLVSLGSYCVVFDTVIEDLPEDMFPDRPWGKGNNPKTAVWEYLRRMRDEPRRAADGSVLSFEIDKALENKLLITVAPDGYLKRVS